MTTEKAQFIPTEKGFPLLGILPYLFRGDPFEYMKNIMVTHGDLVRLNVASKSVYLISGPEYFQRILRDNYQHYLKPGMLYDVSREVSGNGLINSDGNFWLRQRRMIQPHLHRKQLSYLFSDMVTAISDVLNNWELATKNGEVVELSEKMGEISMNVITRTMFGHDTVPPNEVTEISYRISEIIKYIGETLYSIILPKWFPIPGRREFLANLNETRETVNRIIAKCRQNKELSAGLIQMLIDSVDEDSHEQMTEKQLFDEVMTIFIAGYETTATVLTWLGVIIQRHPEILEKLRAEVDQVLGQRMPTFEDVSHLTYTRKVFMETLRMYTPGAFLPRALDQDDKLGNYDIPADSMIIIFYHGLHHNPQVWEKPEVFDPERFTTEQIAARHPFAYIPFSAGPRKCVGDEFAMLEGPLSIAMILQKYNLNILPDQNFSAKMGATMRPGNGVKATLSLRNLG